MLWFLGCCRRRQLPRRLSRPLDQLASFRRDVAVFERLARLAPMATKTGCLVLKSSSFLSVILYFTLRAPPCQTAHAPPLARPNPQKNTAPNLFIPMHKPKDYPVHISQRDPCAARITFDPSTTLPTSPSIHPPASRPTLPIFQSSNLPTLQSSNLPLIQ
jgi:hypothetical protein